MKKRSLLFRKLRNWWNFNSFSNLSPILEKGFPVGKGGGEGGGWPGLNVFLSKHLLNKMTAKGLLSHCLNPVQNVTRGTEALRQKLFHFMVRPSTFVPVKVFLADQIFFSARGYDLGWTLRCLTDSEWRLMSKFSRSVIELCQNSSQCVTCSHRQMTMKCVYSSVKVQCSVPRAYG